MKVGIITSCVAGVAMSRMAAEALSKEVKAGGHEVFIEEHGGHKVTRTLSQEDFDSVEVFILAFGITIPDKDRFDGKTFLEVPVMKAVMNPKKIVASALELLDAA